MTVNGADERGSRPIANDTEKIYQIDISSSHSSKQLGKFYGWPDFFGNAEPVTDPKFQIKSHPPLQFVMENHPPVEKPLVELEIGSALNEVDFFFSSSLSSSHNHPNDCGFEKCGIYSRIWNNGANISFTFEYKESRARNCRTKSYHVQSSK